MATFALFAELVLILKLTAAAIVLWHENGKLKQEITGLRVEIRTLNESVLLERRLNGGGYNREGIA